MQLPTLNHFSNEELVNKIKNISLEERLATAEIVLYLSEIDKRGFFRDLGYSSLFSYCTQALGYSEGAAFRRISACRVLGKNPEIYEKLKNGSLSLSAVAELAKVITEENKALLIKSSEGKSRAEVEKVVSQYKSPETPKRERIKAIRTISTTDMFSNSLPLAAVKTSYSIQFNADEELMELYNQAKLLLGNIPMEEILRKLLKSYLKAKSPVERMKRRMAKTVKVSKSRHVSNEIKDKVYLRDNGQCSFVATDGTRCKERHALQIDHIKPFSVGGTHDESNLRLLCPSHNRLYAEECFSPGAMRKYLHREKNA